MLCVRKECTATSGEVKFYFFSPEGITNPNPRQRQVGFTRQNVQTVDNCPSLARGAHQPKGTQCHTRTVRSLCFMPKYWNFYSRFDTSFLVAKRKKQLVMSHRRLRHTGKSVVRVLSIRIQKIHMINGHKNRVPGTHVHFRVYRYAPCDQSQVQNSSLMMTVFFRR